jgi:uncharacterized protein with von Willebrand factor type A (vWA) domain
MIDPRVSSVVMDVPELAVALGRSLHDAGVPATPERAARFARALALVPPTDRARLYWTARTSFVSGREQLEAFDLVFARVFDAVLDPASERGDPTAPPLPPSPPAATPPAPGAPATPGSVAASLAGAAREGGEGESEAVLAAASREERLRETRLERLTPEELAELRRLVVEPPLRRSRRARPARRGQHLDLRATLRRSLRSGGDPVRLARRRRLERPRRLVLLLDVSGSMEPYARAYLTLLRAAHAEAFVFATRLTRLTRALREPNAQAAIDRAVASAPDWSGGTRIGEALRAFNDRYGRRGLARGAVIVIVSDGWERDDPGLLAQEMERLHRLAHRIVWVNPRSAAPGFAPIAGGMAAALPYCDELLSGHTPAALDEVLYAIGADT